MILSRSAEYALRIMAILALVSKERPLRAKDMAEEVNIPVFYLSKILRRMTAGGLLVGAKGHGGGFTLARPADTIRFIEVLEATEGVSGPTPCVFGLDACNDATPRVLHHRWKQLKQNFYSWAERTTLADVQGDVKKFRIAYNKHLLPPARIERSRKNRKAAAKNVG